MQTNILFYYLNEQTIINVIHKDAPPLTTRSPSPVAETQIWEDHECHDGDPYYPSMESQIWNQVCEGYEPANGAPMKWIYASK